tara:strand:+ start:198 stop:839 length:642 start_codon:yes stop_codon:yes gene_type:complete
MENNSYDDFYKNLINESKYGGENGGEGGWAVFYYGVFSDVINENNFKNCAEIGIGYGMHARQILENTNLDMLYLIDPSKYYNNDLFPNDVNRLCGNFENLVKNIKLYLEPYNSKYTWYRQESLTITNDQIADKSLDAVFLDADHSYEAVSKDLPFWWNKLKVGGWLLGDDYNSCHPGTTQAVDEFAEKNNLKLEFLYKKNGKKNYPIYKFVKY